MPPPGSHSAPLHLAAREPQNVSARQTLEHLSRLPLRVRRSLLLVGFHIGRRLGYLAASPAEALRISVALHIPLKNALKIAGEAMFHDLMFAVEWLALKNRTPAGLFRDARAVRITDHEIVQWASEQKAVILATLHMASYATSLAKLLYAHFPGRQVVIVRSKSITEDERQALAKLAMIGVQAEYLFLDRPETFLDLVRVVKRGAVLVTLVDLPHEYGRSCEVDLFWQRASIAIGVADLSALCRAPIVLFRTVSKVLGDEIIVDLVIETGVMTAAKRQNAADTIARYINAAVRAAPAQWHMWDRLPEYSVPSPCA